MFLILFKSKEKQYLIEIEKLKEMNKSLNIQYESNNLQLIILKFQK